ncbi:hypothetical protein M426DRAFT_103832 [Hypoxylon sp. CI-4A]|nr:hypothetical protein M426DRAFT_103832 [Hypoxylon sp. CI-4A]
MTDPASALGLGVGILSLVIQATDECIKWYKSFSEATHMSEYEYLRIGLQIEQQRFLAFTEVSGLLYEDTRTCTVLRVNHIVLKNVLTEIQSLFREYEKRNGKYVDIMGQNNNPWDDKDEPQTSIQELLRIPAFDEDRSQHSKQSISLPQRCKKMRDRVTSTTRKLRTIITEPRRLVWVTIDQDDFKALVDKLNRLNLFLMELLDRHKQRIVEEKLDMHHLELIQIRDDIQSLRLLIEAFSQFHSVPREGSGIGEATVEEKVDEMKRQCLMDLARVKIRRIEIDQSQCVDPFPAPYDLSNSSLDFSTFTISKNDFNLHDYGRRSIASWRSRGVWIEWTEPSSHCRLGDVTTGSHSEERVKLLTRMLYEGMPSDFRAPRCLGYVKSPKSDNEACLGIVFERPSNNGAESMLTTLRHLLHSRPKPSLTARVSLCSDLANCLFTFHAVDWLHKGLRSTNVLFFDTETTGPSLDMPYITGYDLSRPTDIPEMTEKPPFDPWSDIYRHPYAQFGEAKKFYRKSYDIYSLGVILIEVALWQPIEDVLEIGDLAALKSTGLRSVSGRLLGLAGEDVRTSGSTSGSADSGFLGDIARQCGDSYCDIVKSCFEADVAENPSYRGESQTSTKARLRTMFKEQVTDKLQSMKEVLSSSR